MACSSFGVARLVNRSSSRVVWVGRCGGEARLRIGMEFARVEVGASQAAVVFENFLGEVLQDRDGSTAQLPAPGQAVCTCSTGRKWRRRYVAELAVLVPLPDLAG